MKKNSVKIIIITVIFSIIASLASCESEKANGSSGEQNDFSVSTVTEEQWNEAFDYTPENAGKLTNAYIEFSRGHLNGPKNITQIFDNVMKKQNSDGVYYQCIEDGKRYYYEPYGENSYLKMLLDYQDNFWMGMSDDFASTMCIFSGLYPKVKYDSKTSAYILQDVSNLEEDVSSMSGNVKFSDGKLKSANVELHSTSGQTAYITMHFGDVEKIELPPLLDTDDLVPTQSLTYEKIGDAYSVTGYVFSEEEKNIVIPDSYNGLPVTKISANAFNNSPIESIYIPETITEIGADAFDKVPRLSSVIISNISKWSMISFENYASNPWHESTLYLNGETVTEYTVRDDVTSIGEREFSHCYGLSDVIIPNGIIKIGNEAFSYCGSLKTVTISDSVTAIEEWAFSYCDDLKSIIFGSGLKSIGSYAFISCYALESITLPDGFECIENGAFSTCFDLKTVTIPESIVKIGERAFGDCQDLSTITYKGTMAEWNELTRDVSLGINTETCRVVCSDGTI